MKCSSIWLKNNKSQQMKNITAAFNHVYLPQKALVVYQSKADENEVYVEAYDMDENGKPINAHPLSVKETIALADVFNTCSEVNNDFLISKGLLPEKVLYTNHSNGCAIWYTTEQKRHVLFKEDLSISNGEAFGPPMIWKATRDSLNVYSMRENKRPHESTPLYHAPYFNIHNNGNVCMGNVDVAIDKTSSLEEFIKSWEDYFFNSYFSHLIAHQSPVKGNIVQLWKELINTDKPFPKEVLIKNGQHLKDLLQ